MTTRKYNQNTLVLCQWNAECSKCNTIKDISQFYLHSNGKPRTYCKLCHYEIGKVYRKTHKQSPYKDLPEKSKEQKRASARKWRGSNKPYDAMRSRERRARTLKAIPIWADRWYIKLFYDLAKQEEHRTGKKVHVDHIVPLKSNYVCGLHCPHNLQLLYMEDNLSKGNRYAN